MSELPAVKSGWLNLFRPWTLHGAVVTVFIGAAVALKDGLFAEWQSWLIFALVMAGACLLQSIANIFNTYGDFVKGTDTAENHTRSPELVTGVLSEKQVLLAGVASTAAVVLIGLVLLAYTDWDVKLLIIGLIGIFGATMYTIGMSYKYFGLGQASVFFNMGVLMPIGTYLVMARGDISWDNIWELVLLGLPNAFLITAVLCGNEVRDYHDDKKAGAGTMSGHMSYKTAMRLYLAESVIAYPIVLISVVLVPAFVPIGCLLSFVALYDFKKVYENSKKAPEDAVKNKMLVPIAFTHNWHFAGLLVLGYVASLAAGLV